MNKGYLQTERAMGAVHQEDHVDGCCCVACGMKPPELIQVGFPGIHDTHNGHTKARVEDGEVWVTLAGFGVAELAMPKAQAEALRDQLNNAINSL